MSCDSKNECYGTIITCPDNAECNVDCTAETSCQYAIIHCPSTAACNVKCTTTDSCSYAHVLWPERYPYLGTLTVYGSDEIGYPDTPDPPRNVIYAPSDYAAHNFSCDYGSSCEAAYINCPKYADCIVNCTAAESTYTVYGNKIYNLNYYDDVCSTSIINCPITGNCEILCIGDEACIYSRMNGPTNGVFDLYVGNPPQKSHPCDYCQIHAENSDYFNFTIQGLATSASIWFPPKTGDTKRSQISGESTGFLNGWHSSTTLQNWHALNGWLDVDISFLAENWAHQAGIMHCNTDYVDSCQFAPDSFSCASSNTICDNPIIITAEPTISPTTTSSPTILLTTTSKSSSDSKSSSNSNATTFIVIGIMGAILIIVCIIFIFVRKNRKKNIGNDQIDNGREYNHWNCKDVLEWIITLDNGAFKQYHDILKESLTKRNVKGSNLKYVEKSDIKAWGIDDIEHRTKLFEHIRSLMNVTSTYID